ncbi:MAG TPA: hypothetical protein VHU61_02520 [Solirubrobacteraceae bacterium]|nr:hypothetical protein [Solirubrobacteraceae bacterium]
MRDPRQPLVFNHIPKSAGSSLTLALAGAGDEQPLVGFDRYHFGAWDGFDTLCDAFRSMAFRDPGEIPPATRFLAGHVSYSTSEQALPGADHVTVLREPRSRLLSLWTHERGLTDLDLEPYGDWGRWGGTPERPARRPFGEFLGVASLAPLVDNATIRILLWPHPLIPDDRPIDPGDDAVLLAAAIDRLDQLAFVDVMENPAWIDNLGRWLDRPMQMARINETRPLPTGLQSDMSKELSPQVMGQLASLTRLDHRIWAEVAARGLPASRLAEHADAAWAQTVAKHTVLLAGDRSTPVPAAAEIGRFYGLGSGVPELAWLVSGWHHPDEPGVWSTATARIAVPLAESVPDEFVMRIQIDRSKVHDAALWDTDFSGPGIVEAGRSAGDSRPAVSLQIRRGDLTDRALLDVHLHVRGSVRPRDVVGNSDLRLIGGFVRGFELLGTDR